jgi:ectoine hydroxylase-related dioxygenase (phytanoyl-CoA dioxygenase family)
MSISEASETSVQMREAMPYRVSVAEYRAFREQGFLVVRGLVGPEEIAELQQHTEDLMQGRLPEQNQRMQERDVNKDGGVTVQGLEVPPEHLSPAEKAQYFLRIHMLHRRLELHERYMLHPRVLDVLQVLIGPDVLALQTMLFLKPPGKPGQGWHQDSYYIPTHADTLCGAWIAIDEADEFNGAMWMARGSQVEPVYPPKGGYGHGDRGIGDISYVDGVSNPEDAENGLSPIADRYPQVLVPAKPGDVVFFGGHVLHRSKANITSDRFRRAFVSHYCNARSFTQWGADTARFDDVHASPTVDPRDKDDQRVTYPGTR